jgi:hypothetical protein
MPGGRVAITGVVFFPAVFPNAPPHELQCGDAHWSQTDDKVTFDCGGYSTYVVRVDGDTMTGRYYQPDHRETPHTTCLRRLQ